MSETKPQISRDRFADLEGEWVGDETIHPSAWTAGGMAKGHFDIRRDGSGLHLVIDYHEDRADGSAFHAHSVIAIEPESGDWLLFLFDSYGFPPLSPARGQWQGDRLVLEKTTPRGVGQTVFTVAPAALGYSVASRTHEAQSFAPVMDGLYRRAKTGRDGRSGPEQRPVHGPRLRN